MPSSSKIHYLSATLLAFLSLAGQVIAAESAQLADPTPLQDAIETYSDAERHWAYEQTVTEYNRKGQPRDVLITQVDPSLPWDQRDVLIATVKGPATEREKRRYQKDREKDRRKRERGLEDPQRLRDRMDFPMSRIVSETTETRTYAVPLLPDSKSGFPMEKIKMKAWIHPESGELQGIEAKLQEAVRLKAVAKVKNLHLKIAFTRPLPEKDAVALTHLRGTAAASVLFFPVGGEVLVERKSHRWVTPYDDRFNVELGTPTPVGF